jgi:hypothetical protein
MMMTLRRWWQVLKKQRVAMVPPILIVLPTWLFLIRFLCLRRFSGFSVCGLPSLSHEVTMVLVLDEVCEEMTIH